MALMTLEEKGKIIQACFAASSRGDKKEASRLRRSLPLAPHLAMVAKEMYGKKYLIDRGYDLSEADAEFGDGWLER